MPLESTPGHLRRRLAWGGGCALAILAPLLALPSGASRALMPRAAVDAEASITADDLRAHLRFLASDDLQGRGVGHPGNDLAVQYLGAQFERLGLVPAGPNGYYQDVVLYAFVLGKANALAIRTRENTGGEDVSRHEAGGDFYPLQASASASASGPIVFAGYGIRAPDLKYDDYAGLDVKGKVVIALAHEPEEEDDASRFAGRQRSAYWRAATKAATAHALGAVALLIVPDIAQHGSQKSLPDVGQTWQEQPSVQARQFVLAETFDESPLPLGMISPSLAEKLLGESGRDASIEALQRTIDGALEKAGRDGDVLQPAAMTVSGCEATLTVDINRQQVIARNVVGAIEGTDPAGKNEAVVIGAHLDHDGLDSANRIYNGADDDGSGTVAVIEIAEALARARDQGARPRRTIVMGLWNGEEKGSLGSEHYVRHPAPAGVEPFVNLNLDMVGRSEDVPDPSNPRFRGMPHTLARENTNALHLLGYSFSPDLANVVKEENADIGLTLKTAYDRNPQDLVHRSDQWSFLARKIPALFFTTGLHQDYHTPEDDVDKIEFRKMARIARLVYQVAWRLADQDAKPRYVEPSP